jgi:hypothetical protein
MVTFHYEVTELLEAGTSIKFFEDRLSNLLTTFTETIERKVCFNKLEIDTAVKEIVQAMEIWELQNQEDVIKWTYGGDDFYSMKKKFEDLLDIEW